MEFIRKSGIPVTCSPAAVLGTDHIKRNKAANTIFSETKNSPKSPLFLPQHTDVCLSLAGGPKECNLFLDLARFAIHSSEN